MCALPLDAKWRSVLLFGCLLVLAAGCSKMLMHTTEKKPVLVEKPAKIVIPGQKGVFMPFVLAVPLHTEITWQNQDNRSHMIRTTPEQERFLNMKPFQLALARGQSVKFSMDVPGLYHYYEPQYADWQANFKRVKARRGTAAYPLAMDGIIWVRGPIKGLPNAAVNGIMKGHDMFMQEFMAIQATGVIAWHNFDEDPHFVGEVPDWSDPINPSNIGIYRVAGYNDVPGGETTTVQFTQAGLYYYYCRNHDQINHMYLRAQALKKASEYPLPMEGFVLVEPAS